jgi:hypothetical protein
MGWLAKRAAPITNAKKSMEDNMSYIKVPLPQNFKRIKKSFIKVYDSPHLMKAVKRYGYDLDRLNEGFDLIEEAEKLCYEQFDMYQNSKIETGKLQHHLNIMKKTFSEHVALARISLKKNCQKLSELRINCKIKRNFDDFMNQYCGFYKGVLDNPGLLKRFKTHNITRKQLRVALSLAGKIDFLKDYQMGLKKEAVEATKNKNRAIKKAGEWCSDLNVVVALTKKHITN